MKERLRNDRIMRSKARYQIEMRRENPRTGDMQVRLVGYASTPQSAVDKALRYGAKLTTYALFYIRDSEQDNRVVMSAANDKPGRGNLHHRIRESR